MHRISDLDTIHIFTVHTLDIRYSLQTFSVTFEHCVVFGGLSLPEGLRPITFYNYVHNLGRDR